MDSWLPARADLKIRTRELYRWLLDKYILPHLGHLPLDQVTPTVVRAWHVTLSREGSPTPTRQAYALLRAILNTPVADELLTRNPCTVRGAGVARSAERSVVTLAQRADARRRRPSSLQDVHPARSVVRGLLGRARRRQPRPASTSTAAR